MTEAMRPPPPAAKPGRRAAIVLAVIVHLALAVFLIYGVNWQTRAPEAVSVELVAAPPAVPPAPTPAPEPKPGPEPAPPKPAPKIEPAPKPPPPKPDIAIKDKPKPKETPPPAPPSPPRVDPFQEQLKRESEALEQKKAQDEADAYLERMRATQASAARKKDIDLYLARIRGKIRGNIVLPPEVKGNPEAVFDVTQLPSGEIITARLKKSSGIPALDAAIERAILKSSPLPKPDKADLFARSLELRFRPLED